MKVIEIKVPQVGESITEVTLSQWLKQDGDIVALDEPICEIESDKATLEVVAEQAGKLIHVVAEGEDVGIGVVIAKIDTSVGMQTGTPTPQITPVETVEAKEQPIATETYATGHAAPAAAKLMAEHGLTPANIKGTGKDGRILKEDVLAAIEKIKQTPPTPVAPTPPKKETPKPPKKTVVAPVTTNNSTFSRATRRERLSRMRRTIASRLVSVKNNTAMLTTFNEVDLTEIIALRKKYQERFVEKYGIKLGFMSLFTKACAKVLMEMPEVNAQIDGNEIIYHDYADVSIAVSTATGLVVPVIKNCESLQFQEIEYKIKELAAKARDGKLTIEEMTGGTFSITNGGIFGSLQSTPIINPPQSAILGMHGIKKRPVVIGGEIKIRPMMYLALSYDHRVIDGKSAVTFLVKVIKNLEDPVAMMLDL